MNTFVAKDIFLSSSLLSTTRYSILDKNALEISTVSQSKANKERISLDKINPEFEMQYRPNDLWTSLSIGLLISGFIFFSLSQTVTSLWGTGYSALFIVASVVSAIIALKNKTIRYTFFYISTQNKVFSITESNRLFAKKNKTNAETFSTHLQASIVAVESNVSQPSLVKTQDEKFTFLKEKVDDIFNYGLMDEITYDRIIESINDKVYDKKRPQQPFSENVINFQLVKALKESA